MLEMTACRRQPRRGELREAKREGRMTKRLEHYFGLRHSAFVIFFLSHVPLAFSSSQWPSIVSALLLGEIPSRRVMQFSSNSMFVSSNSMILLQSRQIRWLCVGCSTKFGSYTLVSDPRSSSRSSPL